MRRWKGRSHPLRLICALAAVLTLGSLAPAAFAEMLPSLDGTVDAVVEASDQTDLPQDPPDPTPTPSPDPTPTPSPGPTPSPDPSPSPSPSPQPTPSPRPDPTPSPRPDPTPSPTTSPAVTAQRGLYGPGTTSGGGSHIGEGAQRDPGVEPVDEESVPGGAGSFIRSVASILYDLASTGDAPVRAAERTSLCPGSECGSTIGAIGSKAVALVLICVILAVAGALAIRAGLRRSTTDPPAEDA
jgi:hypothetical protein